MNLTLSDTEAILEEAARIAREYLAGHADRDEPVVRYLAPDALRRRFALEPPARGRPFEDLLEDVRETLRYSVRSGHPGFSNQLFGGYDVAAIVGEWMTALLNTSMYTYEVAPVFTLMELALIRHMCGFVGWSDGEGVFTPGGSIANLMALLAARNRALPHAKVDGLRPDDRLALFLSDEAHYSVTRASSVAGLGTSAAHKVPVDALGRMRPDDLRARIADARSDGLRPFFLSATASTTVAGAFDPLEELAEIAAEHGMWLHVDASYGGGVLMSKEHRELMNGCDRADSITWNPHKMMGVPLACSALLIREKGRLAATNSLHADYLFHDNEAASYDMGDLTLQCGRRVDALKLWLSWQALGDEGHEERIDHLFELADTMREMVVERPAFELIRYPQACNICFRYVPPALRDAEESNDRRHRLGELTVKIRERLREEGRLLTNYAPLDGVPVFRWVASNPRVTRDDLELLLDEIERTGAEF